MGRVLQALFFGVLLGLLAWMAVRLVFGGFGAHGIGDARVLVIAVAGGVLWEIGLLTLTEEAKANPKDCRHAGIIITAGIVALSYVVIAFAYPERLRDAVPAEVQIRRQSN